jgi:catechol 2,3-dioxygenase-like lactoylglutathione lyase family enzyme
MALLRIDHVQLAMPAARESEARRFYGDVLGLREVPKPPALTARGGLWFELGGVQLHLGVDPDFRPAKKAHVAFEVDGLDSLAARCRTSGHEPRGDSAIEGQCRFFVDDPFGNSVELMAARDAAHE